MKITEIEIEQFGPWKDWSLPLTADGLTVVSGANESGKSALRRFIRGVLFGFQSEDFLALEPWQKHLSTAGSLRVRHRGQLLEIRRAAHDGGSGLVTTRRLAADSPQPQSQSLIEHCDWETDDDTDRVSPGDETATLPLSDSVPDLLGHLSETLFDQVFSLGLRELHELAMLSNEEVHRVIHGETLGPQGQQLLTARDELSADIKRSWDATESDSLPQLLDRFRKLDSQIQSQNQRVVRYGELVRTRRQSERRLSELQSRRTQVQQNLHGYTHIERVWIPWQRLRNLQAEQARLPRIDDFPEGGVARFDEIEQELRAALRCRETLRAEAKQFHHDAKAVVVPRDLRRCAASMRGLLDQREHIGRLEDRARQAHAAMKAQKEKLDTQISALGADWTPTKLEALDTSVAANYRLVEKARQFRRAAARRQRRKQRLIRLSQTCQRLSAEINDGLKKLGGLSPDAALRRARQRRHVLPVAAVTAPVARPIATIGGSSELEPLQMRIVELEQRRVSISRQIERLEPKLLLPYWVLAVLGFFAVGGITLALLGVATGFASNALAGAAYALLGTACGGLSLSLKMHFEQQIRESIGQLNQELRDNEACLREARDAWEKLTGTEPAFTTLPRRSPTIFRPESGGETTSVETGTPPHSEGEFDQLASVANSLAHAGIVEAANVFSDVTHQLRASDQPTSSDPDASLDMEDIERLMGLQQQLLRLQRKRAPWRERFDAAARDFMTARQAWCETLRQLGLPESVRIAETFDLWQRLAAANEQRGSWRSAEADFKRHLENLQNVRGRVIEILHRLNRRDLDAKPAAEVFEIWQQQLDQLTATLQERLRPRNEERRRRAEAAEYREQIDDLRQQRSALLRQGCATDRDDYARRATIVERHDELQRQIEAVKDELAAVSRANPELAIVEDDLLRFEAGQHAATLIKLRREADEIDGEIEQLHETLGRMRHEIEQLERDDQPSDLRLEREIVRSQIKAAAEAWLADEWVAQSLDGICSRYERVCQPGIVAAASRYFARLTEGRYRTLWTPLRNRSLRVDDAAGHTWRLEQLSDSSRELLLLAIRLALVEELRRRGCDLPLLLDDVLLTLDPARAAVAARELIDFARRGPQVLFFTSHPHLVTHFTTAGCPHIRLGQHLPTAERLAG